MLLPVATSSVLFSTVFSSESVSSSIDVNSGSLSDSSIFSLGVSLSSTVFSSVSGTITSSSIITLSLYFSPP